MLSYSSVSAVPFVYDGDPAIDKDSPAYSREQFEKTGDLAHLPLVAGSTARIFRVKRLSRRQFFRVMSLQLTEQVQEAVAYGLVSMEPSDADLKRKASDTGERLTDASLDKLFDLGPQVMIALGSYIVGLGKPDPT